MILNCKAISMYYGTYKKINNCYLFDKTNLLKKTNNEFTSIMIISNTTEIKPTTTSTTTSTTTTTTTERVTTRASLIKSKLRLELKILNSFI
jgi:hypothetical protein